MICDHCEEEIVGDAICLDCFHIALLENQPEKTPLELAAGNLLNALKDLQKAVREHNLLDIKKRFSLCAADAQANTAIIKAQGNPSPQPNPAGQDVHKSVE